MIFAATWADTVSLGSALVMLTIIASTGSMVWVYARRESASVWRSVAEGFEERVGQLNEAVNELKGELEVERAKPNQELLVNLVSQSLGSMAAVTKHVTDLAKIVETQEGQSNAAMAAMTTTMQHTGVLIQDLQKEVAAHEDRAMERHTAAMALLVRADTERTRKTDNPKGRDA